MQNEIIQDIQKLRYINTLYDVAEIGRLLAEIRIKYNMEDSVRQNAAENNMQINTIYLTKSSYSEHIELANQYISILEEKLFISYTGNYLFSNRAINLIYNNTQNFNGNQVLHRSGVYELKVSDVLKVIGYVKDIYETVGGKVDDRFSIALMVLDSIDLALNNKKQDKPVNKLLHLTNDVLSEIAKKAADDERVNPLLSGMSLLVKLTIDFFIKE